ncbi:MAG: hypothetical protein BGN86_14780 [Caulobacterales bacterium 68-7]|nr:MAG: hypothetical protein BGN86_14780 [Caulobacterales bacterium 68-7]
MLPITSHLAVAAAIALVTLSFAVSLRRMKVGVEVGLGDDVGLLRRVRAQGNFIEYVPLVLLLSGLAEYRGAGPAWLLTVVGLIVLGRASHAVGMLRGSMPLRAVGMLATYGAILAGAGAVAFG